ncbi:hypothetical protein [Levilactobacillus huananensis]|uniref:hypothetical protein n=1 Tax=Levilactobacillus huananensis TaxID=2486019 RepID=UPI000F76811F|nr:hypothetical protein [Levilactobacillus huananensis]
MAGRIHKRHFLWWLFGGISVLVVIELLFLLPVTPKNTVRWTILRNGHPLQALEGHPVKESRTDTRGSSGKRDWDYYRFDHQVMSYSGGYESNEVGVWRPAGHLFYRGTLTFDVG